MQEVLIDYLVTWLEVNEGEFNLLICGSRGLDNPYPIYRQLLPILTDPTLVKLGIKERLVIIEGGARGIDITARNVAKSLNLKYRTFEADWNAEPRRAGFIRNAEMVAISHATMAVWDEKSKGTKHSIDISEKKGIPIVIDPDKIPNGADDDTIVNFMVKRHLCNSLVFPVGTNETDYLAKIEEYIGDNILEHLTSMHEASDVKPEYLNGTSLEYMFQPIMAAGYTGRVIQKALVTILKFKDVVTPKVVNKVYMKLDTGGLSGYRRDLRAKGEEVYPILRITVKVNSHDPLDIIINPGDKEGVVDDKTREIHTNSGLWLEALKSEISLAKARSMVEDYFKSCNLRNTNPTDNVHTHLVGFNTAFIRSFVQAQLPGLLGMCSPRDVDVNQLSSLLEISSSYEHIPIPQIWRNDPVRYIISLECCVNSIIDPTYSEDVPF